MGTNYYAITKKKDLVEEHFPYDYTLTDEPYFGYEIHIGKRSMGWKPLFQEHSGAYGSVKEMLRFFEDHSDDFELYDEYLETMTLDRLKEELVDWGDWQRENRYARCRFEFNQKDRPYSELVEVKDDEPYDVEVPFDHITYDRAYVDARHRAGLDSWRTYYDQYFRDPDGYDFTKGDFS